MARPYRANALFDAHTDDPEFGYRYLGEEAHEAGQAIKDACSGRVVGYSIDSRMKSRLAVAALNNAVARRGVDGAGVAGCVVRSDRGSQFRSRKFVRVLSKQTWATRDQLRIAIITWIERTYHRRRRQDRLGQLTPIEYETITTTPANQAA